MATNFIRAIKNALKVIVIEVILLKVYLDAFTTFELIRAFVSV